MMRRFQVPIVREVRVVQYGTMEVEAATEQGATARARAAAADFANDFYISFDPLQDEAEILAVQIDPDGDLSEGLSTGDRFEPYLKTNRPSKAERIPIAAEIRATWEANPRR